MSGNSDHLEGYECVDPSVSARLPELASPDLDDTVRRELENHLLICDACRLKQAARETVAAGLRDGRLTLPSRRGAGPRFGNRRRWGGWLAVAASLVLMFWLPPRAEGPGGVSRSAETVLAFERPLEGEVVWSASPRLSWHAVDGASGYRISVTDADGAFQWQRTTRLPFCRLPADAKLDRGQRFRAVVETLPTDLAPPGGVSVVFTTGRFDAYLRYRLRRAHPAVFGLGLAGLLLALLPRRRGASA